MIVRIRHVACLALFERPPHPAIFAYNRSHDPDERMIQSASNPDRLLGWMESLADPTRLRLLRLLERHELGVAELCDIVQLPQSTVSRHLKVLADQKWVRSRRQGTNHLYRTILDELDVAARKLWIFAREQTEGWPAIKQDRFRLDRLLSAKQDDGAAFFAGAAGEWDKLRGELYGRSFTDEALLSLLPPGTIVADLGCGTGPVAARLAPFVKQVIGVDNSAAMLKAARKRIGDAPNIDLRRGDLSAIPIEDASVDAALLILALTYVADPDLALRELSRILKPHGRAVIVDLLPHDREDFRRQMGQTRPGFDPVDLTSLLKQAGLTNIHIRPIPPEPAAKGPALFLATGAK
jgi:ArsR family transcriptional regulator